MRVYLFPQFLIDDPYIRAEALYLYNNWRNVKGRLGFEAAFGIDADTWKMFDYPSDLGFIDSFAKSLELIAYFNMLTTGVVAYGRSQWNNFYGKQMEKAMEMLAWIYSGSNTRPQLFRTSPASSHPTLAGYTKDDNFLPYDKALLLEGMANILAEPWRLLGHPSGLNLKQKIDSFIHYIGPQQYTGFTPASWSPNQPIFLSDIGNALKPFYGYFGQSNSMPIQMNGISRDVSWNLWSRAEYDYINSMLSLQITSTRTTAVALPWIEKIYGSESIGEGSPLSRATGIKVRHQDAFGVWHDQYGDLAQKLKGGAALFEEIYGDEHRPYFNTYELKCPAYSTNGYPVIFNPTAGVTPSVVFNRYRPAFLMRATPFHDTKTQGELFQKIVGEIASQSIIDNPTNPNNWLHFHDILFGMRVPQNMQNWGIYGYFGSHADAELWVERIQFIFGIHVNPANNHEFDYIINNPATTNMPSNVPNYNPSINVADPNYNAFYDPWLPGFDRNRVTDDLTNANGVINNYRYMFWNNYFDYLAGVHNGFWILMNYLP